MNQEEVRSLEQEIRDLFIYHIDPCVKPSLRGFTDEFLNACSDDVFCLLYVKGFIDARVSVVGDIKQRMLKEAREDAFAWLYCTDLSYEDVETIMSDYNVSLSTFRGGTLLPFFLKHLKTRQEVLARLPSEQSQLTITIEESQQLGLPRVSEKEFRSIATKYTEEQLEYPAIQESNMARIYIEEFKWADANKTLAKEEVFAYLSKLIEEKEFTMDKQCELLEELGACFGFPVALSLQNYPWQHDPGCLSGRQDKPTFEAEQNQQGKLVDLTGTKVSSEEDGLLGSDLTVQDTSEGMRDASVSRICQFFSECVTSANYESVWEICRENPEAKKCFHYINHNFSYDDERDYGKAFKHLFYDAMMQVPEFQCWMWLVSFLVTVFVAASMVVYLEAVFFWPGMIASSVAFNEYVDARDILSAQHQKLSVMFKGAQCVDTPIHKV